MRFHSLPCALHILENMKSVLSRPMQKSVPGAPWDQFVCTQDHTFRNSAWLPAQASADGPSTESSSQGPVRLAHTVRNICKAIKYGHSFIFPPEDP